MSANFQPTDAGGAYVWPDEASAESYQDSKRCCRTTGLRNTVLNVNKACESYEHFMQESARRTRYI